MALVVLIALTAVLLVGLVVPTSRSGDADDQPDELADDPGGATQDQDQQGRDPALDDVERPDPTVPEDQQLTAPDVRGFSAGQMAIARMLLDIDASERSMLAFQLQVQQVFSDPGGEDPQIALTAVEEAARSALSDLEVLGGRLQPSHPQASVDAVRQTYLDHLEAWVAYLSEVEQEPEAVLAETPLLSLEISRTGDVFARAVEDFVASGVDPELSDYAERLVERGFRPATSSEV